MQNRKTQKSRFIILCIEIVVATLAIMYYSCHSGYVVRTGIKTVLLIDTIEHIIHAPLKFLPTSKEWIGYGVLYSFTAALVLYYNYNHRKHLRPNEENGTAQWNEEYRAFAQTYTDKKKVGTGSNNMILTKHIYLSMDTLKTQRNNNIVCFGSAGTGKSRYLIKPNILQANASFVVTDPSGELLEATGDFLVNEGYEIRVLNLNDMEHSNRYNPFRYIHKQEDVSKMITALIKNTTPPDSQHGDPFWEKAETALLEALCFYIIETFDPDGRSFATIMELLRLAAAPEGQPSTLDLMFAELAKKHPDHVAVKAYGVYKSAGDGKTADSIRVICQSRLGKFNLDAVDKLTSTDNFHLEDVGDKKVAIFVLLSEAETTFSFLASMLFTQLFDTLYRHAKEDCPNKRLKVPVRFLLDEFANIGEIPDFPARLATMRKYGISCTIILQSISQIKKMYKENWEDVLNNCDSTLFLGGSGKDTTDYVSDILGKETIRTTNTSSSNGTSGNSSTSYNATGRELMTAAELRMLDNRSCIYILRGVYPFLEQKYDYTKHPNYHLTADADPTLRFDVEKYFKNQKRRAQNR